MKTTYFFRDGRTAFFWGMKSLRLNQKNKILLPAYIGASNREGSGVFDPIRRLKAGYRFYALREDFSFDKKDFLRRLKKKNVKAVLVIHYFGFCQPDFDFIIKNCNKYGKYLIEDCAHAFNSFWKGKKLGAYGDMSFYSIHKFLPARSGGVLKVNNPDIRISSNIKEDIPPSALKTFACADLAKISKTRKSNYVYLLNKMSKVKGVRPLYRRLPGGIAPLNFPVIIENGNRDKIYFYLRRNGVRAVSLYYKLIPQISRKNYPASHYLSKRILNLPIHKAANKKEAKYIIETLAAALAKKT